MRRICKFLGIIIVLGIVFFIICDEKGYKINWSENQIVLVEAEKKSESNNEAKKDEVTELKPVVLYKNSDLIRLNPAFRNPKNLRKSEGIDPAYLAKLEQEKAELEAQKNKQVYTGPNMISLNDENSISSFFHSNGRETVEKQEVLLDDENEIQDEEVVNPEPLEISEDNFDIVSNNDLEDEQMVGDNQIISDTQNAEDTVNNNDILIVGEEETLDRTENLVKIEKYQLKQRDVQLSEGVPVVAVVSVDKYTGTNHELDLNKGVEIVKVKIEKYRPNKNHTLNVKKGVVIQSDFVVQDNINSPEIESGISDEMIEDLLVADEIDMDSLESDNDEFLQKVFQHTNDKNVMNLIVSNYLNEYQFVKAKKFIESLPESYLEDLKPLLNLRVAFNSFALTSKTTNETLTSLVQSYQTKNQISSDDSNWYLGVLLLMQRKYDDFFAIADRFTSENHKEFTSKLQGYKDQISKQMGMPDYYFDTLVALELFNQGLFQPAKVLALYSLQQNSDYILPYQILAYANFLTNSRETSVEYLKKLVNLDQNNAEKYRFLMGVAYYWAEKYEQSVTMLSMIQNDNLRLDAQRYLINDYLRLDQKNKLILTRNKLLGYEDLVASDFYTYFYEVFYHPYSEGGQYQLYAFDTELTNKMLRVCSMKLSDEEKAVCTYGSIGRNIALGKFEGLEQYLLDLATQYPQGYLYQALGDYYIQQGDNDKARTYLLKAVSMTNNKSEIFQIKNLLQGVM